MHGPRGRQDGVVACQVPGCTREVPDKASYKKCKICPYHINIPEIVLNGRTVRFCRLCRKFQSLEEFAGERKSCRKELDKHNARRRKHRGPLDGAAASPLALPPQRRRQQQQAGPALMQQASSQDTQSDPSGELPPLTARSKPPTGLRGAALAKAGSTLSAHTSLGGDGSSGDLGPPSISASMPPLPRYAPTAPAPQQHTPAVAPAASEAAAAAAAAGLGPGNAECDALLAELSVQLGSLKVEELSQLMNSVEMKEMLSWLPGLLDTARAGAAAQQAAVPAAMQQDAMPPPALTPAQQLQALLAQHAGMQLGQHSAPRPVVCVEHRGPWAPVQQQQQPRPPLPPPPAAAHGIGGAQPNPAAALWEALGLGVMRQPGPAGLPAAAPPAPGMKWVPGHWEPDPRLGGGQRPPAAPQLPLPPLQLPPQPQLVPGGPSALLAQLLSAQLLSGQLPLGEATASLSGILESTQHAPAMPPQHGSDAMDHMDAQQASGVLLALGQQAQGSGSGGAGGVPPAQGSSGGGVGGGAAWAPPGQGSSGGGGGAAWVPPAQGSGDGGGGGGGSGCAPWAPLPPGLGGAPGDGGLLQRVGSVKSVRMHPPHIQVPPSPLEAMLEGFGLPVPRPPPRA